MYDSIEDEVPSSSSFLSSSRGLSYFEQAWHRLRYKIHALRRRKIVASVNITISEVDLGGYDASVARAKEIAAVGRKVKKSLVDGDVTRFIFTSS